MKTKNKLTLLLAFVVIGLSSCKKEFDAPPQHVLAAGNVITMDSLVNMYQGTSIHFTTDLSVYGVVTADETDGNLYKSVFVQNGNAAINLHLINSGGIYRGDSVRIYLKGTTLMKYNGMLQLDSVNVDVNIIKQSTGVVVNPTVVGITDLNAGMQSRLVKLDNVEFDALELSNTWADAVNQTSQDRVLTDCSGNTVIVRTSGYALYAGNLLPQGNGSLTAVVGVYGSTIQLYIRSLGETSSMTGARCSGFPPYLYKDFTDGSITSGGWTVQAVTGTATWAIYSSAGNNVASISNYFSSANHLTENWLISPAVDLTSTTNPGLNFQNAYKYTGAPLEVYVSTDYVSGAPSTATWVPLTGFVWSSGSFTFVGSGNVSLASYKTTNTHVAFKYSGSNSDGSTWEVDEITVEEF